jgi:hypothetical protein
MAVVAVVVFALTGCFKKVTTDTLLVIKTLVENESGGERTPITDTYGYIYYPGSEDWGITSYEDAAAKIITNHTTGEKLSTPDVESGPYTIEGSTNNYIGMWESASPAFVVVVYPSAKMYAYMYRKHKAENLPETFLTLIFHTWKKEPYTQGRNEGYRWTVVPPPATSDNTNAGGGESNN